MCSQTKAFYLRFDRNSSTSSCNRNLWKIFGKSSIKKSDKKFIDLRDELPKKLEKKLSVIYKTDFEKDNFGDSCNAFSGNKGILLNKSNQESISLLSTKNLRTVVG